MAISHCSVRRGLAGKGGPHALYVQGEGRYGDRADVEHIEHGNMPSFATADPMAFWQAADANERANGRAYTELQYAVPRELTEREDQIRFARRMADGIVGVKHPYTLAMHDAKAADGARNVHVHLMFSERQLDGIERGPEQFFKRAAAPYRHRVTKEMMPADPAKGGAAKDRAMNAKTFVTDVRMRYERLVNAELERLGVDARISMKANPRQEPEPKLGPAHPRADFNVAREARLARVRELRLKRIEFEKIIAERQALQSQIIDLTGDISTAKAEREQQRQTAPAPLSSLSVEERRRMLVGDDVPDPSARLKAFHAAMEADLQRNPPKIVSEREKRARDVEAAKAQLAKLPTPYALSRSPVNEAHGRYSGHVLLVTDFHVAQDWGRREAVLHDRAKLSGSYQAGDKVLIQYDNGRGRVEQKPDRSLDRSRPRIR
ncbi:MobA/MobL family protein [Caballeronia sp. AZ1_KS37]|uniref:MobA/MobL family protein n=1 Tax=Caballeronia sp. AZ1_KS37 TaxID=2921756 RepID=UPI002027C287|nr:MobA/MobL family protein [Caballeronia sp. AZ1_KS37]